jgi:hypothetical protein
LGRICRRLMGTEVVTNHRLSLKERPAFQTRRDDESHFGDVDVSSSNDGRHEQ